MHRVQTRLHSSGFFSRCMLIHRCRSNVLFLTAAASARNAPDAVEVSKQQAQQEQQQQYKQQQQQQQQQRSKSQQQVLQSHQEEPERHVIHQRPQVPSVTEFLSEHGARLTTAAQMVWAQVLQPGAVAVDATCGNGHDSLFMAECIGPSGQLHAFDLQASAVTATTQLLQSSLPAGAMPQLNVQQACHSQLQALVGSNLASLVAFNLGYLPGGDKRVITRTDSTVAAVEAALEVLCPGGLISIMAYTGHPGGQEEYEAVRSLLSGLSPRYWTSSELRLLNRPSAPILLLLWRRPDAAAV